MRCASILHNGFHTWTMCFALQKCALLVHTLLVSALEKPDDPQFSTAWDHLYQTPQVWSKIGELGPMLCASILHNGYHTWTTCLSLQKRALLMHTLTGVAMVHNTFANYRDVLLYWFGLLHWIRCSITRYIGGGGF